VHNTFMGSFHVPLLFFAALCASTPSFAQPLMQHPTPPISAEPGSPDQTQAEDEKSRMERDMAKKANEARQAALKKDTDKLVKLSNELKDYVDKSNENILSVDVVKKAEEIEKLAHSVKEKMKGSN